MPQYSIVNNMEQGMNDYNIVNNSLTKF